MRKVSLFIAASLDGFIARKNGGIDWLFHGDYGYKKFYSTIDTVIMGRKTYDLAKRLEKEPFKSKRVVVFTRHAVKGAEFSRDPITALRKMLKERGKRIWLVGGGKIARVLMNAKMIDELVISVHPRILGSGIPLFEGMKETKLKHARTKAFKSGLVQITYKVKS